MTLHALLAPALGISTLASAPGPHQALVDVVQAWVDRRDVVGAELLVLRKGACLVHRGFGLRDGGDPAPLAPGTLFGLRSMTKPLTGAAVMILVDRGLLRLEDSIGRHLPDWSGSRIQVRHLLEHRTGLPLTLGSRHESLQAIVRAARGVPLEFEPGEAFGYSDAGVDVAAALVEAVSGQDFEAFLRRELLEPLGMVDTFFLRPEDPRGARLASLHMGQAGAWRRIWKPGDPPLHRFLRGSQGLVGTASDYARFLAMLGAKGLTSRRRILSPAAVAELLRPVSDLSAPDSCLPFSTSFTHLDPWYGRTLQLYRDPGGQVIGFGHGGSDGTYAWCFPGQDLVVCLFTACRGQTPLLRFENVIDRILLRASTPPCEGPDGGITGLWYPSQNPGAPWRVVLCDDRFFLDRPGRPLARLHPPDREGKWRIGYGWMTFGAEARLVLGPEAVTLHRRPPTSTSSPAAGGSPVRLAPGLPPHRDEAG